MMRNQRDERGDRPVEGREVVVVGGGLGGVAAATVLAERGVRVTVVERNGYLGGRAGAWSDHLEDGTSFEMERGFHGFFRQYYNLRALIRRVDPNLSCLTPLADYPVLGPDGARECFTDLPRVTPLNLVELVRRTPHLRISDLPKIPPGRVAPMLSFDPEDTYERWDRISATEYLDSLNFPSRARRMLFDVFSHSFFSPEEELSAAELLMMFHFYFVGNPEGLVFDVMNEPFSIAFWRPIQRYLESRGVRFSLSTEVASVEDCGGGRFQVHTRSGDALAADGVVLATTVGGLRGIVDASSGLGEEPWRRQVASLEATWPFAVWRLWMDRTPRPDRQPFVATAGLGHIDNISIYDRFEGESRRWALSTGGSVIELHAYAVPPGAADAEVRANLLDSLHLLYPEMEGARILEERWILGDDCPAFRPGAHGQRPTTQTPVPGLVLAGDFVRFRSPSALMERATTTGFDAANVLLRAWGGRPEPIRSVPDQGLLARFTRRRRRRRPDAPEVPSMPSYA